MPTVINNPAPSSQGNNGFGFLIGVIVLIVFVVLVLMYGLPYLQTSLSSPQVTVPEKIDVNIHQQ